MAYTDRWTTHTDFTALDEMAERGLYTLEAAICYDCHELEIAEPVLMRLQHLSWKRTDARLVEQFTYQHRTHSGDQCEVLFSCPYIIEAYTAICEHVAELFAEGT